MGQTSPLTRPRAPSALLRRLAAALWALASITAAAGAAHTQDLRDGQVTLPWSEATRLLDVQAPDAPAFDHAVRRNHLRASVEHGRLHVHQTVEVDVYRAWAVVPLVPDSVGIIAVQHNGHDASMVRSDGDVAAVVSTIGPHRFEIDYLALGKAGVGESAIIPLVERPLLIAEIATPDPDWTVLATPSAQSVTRPAVSPEAPLTRIVVPRTNRLEVRWEQRFDGAAAATTRLTAEIRNAIRVEETGIEGQAEVLLAIEGEPTATVTLQLPAALEGARVDGEYVRTVEASPNGDRLVRFAFAQSGGRRLTVRYSLGDNAATRFAVPSIGVQDATAVRGAVAITSTGGIEVQPVDADLRGLEAADSSELPEAWLPDPDELVFAYRFFDLPIAGQFDIHRYARQEVLASAIQTADVQTVVTEDDKAVTRLRLVVTNNSRQFLRLTFPDDTAEIWSAFVDDRPVKPARDDQGRLLIPLRRSERLTGRLASFPVELTFYQHVESPSRFYGAAAFTLPKLDMVAADVLWTVWISDRYAYFDHGGTLSPTEDSRAPLTFDAEGDEDIDRTSTGQGEGKKSAEVLKDVQEKGRDAPAAPAPEKPKDAAPTSRVAGLLPVRLEIPTSGTALRFRKPLAREGEELAVDFRYYNRGYVKAAEYTALVGLFATLLAFFAHLLLAIKRGRLSRSRLWSPAALVGLGVFAVLQALLPIPFPAWWVMMLLAVGAGSLYGTVVFWTTIIGLAHELWARFGRPEPPRPQRKADAEDDEDDEDNDEDDDDPPPAGPDGGPHA